jgi:hypothetical protein
MEEVNQRRSLQKLTDELQLKYSKLSNEQG